MIITSVMHYAKVCVTCSANKGTTETVDHDSGTEQVKLLSPAVNPGEPALDDSVRCRMAGICEGLDACGRGEVCLPLSWTSMMPAATYCLVPCCAVLRCAVLRCAALCCAALCCAALCCAVLC